MKSNTIYLLLLVFFFTFSFCSKKEIDTEIIIEEPTEEIYFPPLNSTEWDTKSISDLKWNENQLEPLLEFLEEKNTKSFIMVKL